MNTATNAERRGTGADGGNDGTTDRNSHKGDVLVELAHASLCEYLGLQVPQSSQKIIEENPWLDELGASFVTLTKNGDLRGCIGTLEAYRSLGRDVAAHAVDAAVHDPRFWPVTAQEYPELACEVSVLSAPEPITVAGAGAQRTVQSRAELEQALQPGMDGLILVHRSGRRATFLPQVWDELPNPHDFVSHLLAKAGLQASYDWNNGEIDCSRYTVTAYHD